MKEVKLPSATYIVCDPCYVMHDDLYMQMIDDLYKPSYNGQMHNHWDLNENGQVAVFNTAYGDGYYSSNKDINFPVDAGIIGAVDIRLCDPESVKKYIDSKEAYLIECSSITATSDGENLSFNDITVYTNYHDDEEDEDEY